MTIILALIAYIGWVYWRSYTIRIDNEKYLTRIILARTPWFRVFLHRIYRPDAGRHLHNHPWPWARAIVLRGGYVESILARRWPPAYYNRCFRIHHAGDVSREAFRAGYFHRITKVKPNTWTLFLAGKHKPGVGWGFLTPEGYVPANVYLKDYRPLYD